MRPECIAEVAATLGRTPTKTEIDAIEGDVLRAMREVARTEPKWKQMTGQQRLQAAATLAHEQALQHAEVTAQRRAGNLLVQARESARLQARAAQLKAAGRKNASHSALFERMRQSDDYVAGIRNEALSDLTESIHAVSPRFLGLVDDPNTVRAFAKAVMDGDKSDPDMARAAQTYMETMENLRLRSNAAGTDIGKLDYGYLPQPHDSGRIARAGKQAWVDAIMPKLKRDQYVRADGAPMDDAEMATMLDDVYDTLATEGRSKRTPGQRGGGSRASRFDDAHRALHFADADAYLAYLADFGRGTMMSSIHGHVGMMAKTIGLMEEFGANPNNAYRLLKDMAEIGDNKVGVHESFATLDMVWDTLNGTTAQPVSPGLAQFFQGARNFTTAAKLQGVMLSAITDAPLQVIVAKSAGVPLGDSMKSVFNGFGSSKRVLAHDLAIGMDEIAGEMARWSQDNLAQGWTSKLANTTMRLTLVEGWTNALRRGYALTLSSTLDRLRATDWGSLHVNDTARLAAAGVTEADWRLWQLAKPTTAGKTSMLTKNGLRGLTDQELAAAGFTPADRNRATARLIGYLDQEARTAVLSPDIQTRAMVQQGTKAGTVGGEMLRTMMLFKTFAFAIVDKHLRRMRNIPDTKGRAAYAAAMMTSLTVFGAVSMQLKDLVQGKDPRDMSTGKFWLAAFMQGGGIGIFGDLLYTSIGGNSRGGQPNWANFAGPVFGTGLDAADMTLGNASRYAKAKNSREREKVVGKTQADALRFAKGNTPFINLWYARAAIDHLVLHDLQEQVSPGYLRKMRKRSQNEWGQDYWWEPGENLPDRAPSAAAAVGAK